MAIRPNIMQIICHDLGRHLRCYGRLDVESPTLDQLAAEGVRLENCFTASPPCSPARGCLMTGRYAHSTGHVGLTHRGFPLPVEEETLVDHFNRAGYFTANFGFQHERADPRDNRYQCEDHESYHCEVVARKAVDFFAHPHDSNTPFYLNLGFSEVHLPFDRPEYLPESPEHVGVPAWLPDNIGVREELGRFHGSIRFMDQSVAVILDALAQTGLKENTLVLFTTDHGMAFPRAKGMLYDPGIGVAAILRLPYGQGAPGQVIREIINSIDLAPTLLEAAGLPIPPAMQGRSFLGLLTGGNYQPRECVFAEKNYHDCYDPIRAVRTPRYKFLQNFEERPRIILSSDLKRSSASRELWPWARQARPAEELYDLEADPWEMHNLAGLPEVAGVQADLQQQLQQWRVETNDPLLRGPIPAPAGARVDPPDPIEP